MRKTFKCLILLAVCFLLTFEMHAATEIVVYNTDNAVLFRGLLEDEPTLNFTETGLEIKSPDMETLLPNTEFTTIGEIVFNDNVDPSAIRIPETAGQGLTFQFTDGKTVLIGGLMPEQQVRVLTLDGRQISANMTNEVGIVSIDLSPFSQGYYIINIGKQSFKIFKK